jgi:hypothetical protein
MVYPQGDVDEYIYDPADSEKGYEAEELFSHRTTIIH